MRPSDAGLGLALLLRGAAALLAAAALSGDSTSPPARPAPVPPPRRRAAGGPDLTGIDPSRPFIVDFSVPAIAPSETKRASLNAMREAMLAMNANAPQFLIQTRINADQGVFELHVTPLGKTVASSSHGEAHEEEGWRKSS